ncbi:hypothetical protein GA0061103_5902 [Rhizobium multihospitium]|uniref:Uncharacterized protein n=1 Tax=Rhizobium multihospitium TaxID=410764 RepID=A0A1C3WP51_9HYPH|nr:hypothetical protein GA0061103_5902 [Rhizobium multihospitium]
MHRASAAELKHDGPPPIKYLCLAKARGGAISEKILSQKDPPFFWGAVGLSWLQPLIEPRINGASRYSRLHHLSIADLAGLVNVFSGEADVSDGSSVTDWNGAIPATFGSDNLTAFLRGIILVGKATLGHGFDFEGISLCPIDGADQAPWSHAVRSAPLATR